MMSFASSSITLFFIHRRQALLVVLSTGCGIFEGEALIFADPYARDLFAVVAVKGFEVCDRLGPLGLRLGADLSHEVA